MNLYETRLSPMPPDGAPALRAEVKYRAVIRLLEWGFDTDVIARVVGCGIDWIHAIDRVRSRETEQEQDVLADGKRWNNLVECVVAEQGRVA